MATLMTVTVIHVVILILYIFTIYCTFCVLDIPNFDKISSNYNFGQLKYLTVWNVIAQTLFFLICLLNDIFGMNNGNLKKRPFIRKFKDFYHATIGFPVSMFVGLTFWGLMFVNRELVLPTALDPYFPWWLNHLMHTMILITTTLEMLIAPRNYPKRLNGLFGLIGFMLIYLAWMHFIYYMNGVWAYPVIEILTWPLRIIFYLSLLVFATGLYYIGEFMNHILWGNTFKSTKENTKKIQ